MILKTKKAINLSGKMSILGVSKIERDVMDAMSTGAKHFYKMDDLYQDAQKLISNHFNSQQSFITSSASAGIMQTIFAIKSFLGKETINVALPIGHHIDYGAPISKLIEIAGGNIIPIGFSNRLSLNDLKEINIDEIDVAFFVESHHSVQKNHLSAKEFNSYFSKKKILTVVDAAAEEDIWKINKYSYDFSIFSGSKSLSGPTSGFVLYSDAKFKKDLSETRSSLGRAMKIGKESIFGLVAAIDKYSKKRSISKQELNINSWLRKFTFKDIFTSIIVDQRNIKRIKLLSKKEIVIKINKHLNKNNIFTRDYHIHEGWMELDFRQTSDKELEFVILKIKEVLNG